MYFFEDVCMPSDDTEISFYEDALELGVLNHKAALAVDLYTQELYMEEEDSSGSDGVFEKMKKAILTVLDKIDSIIRGFLDGFKVFSNKHLTADKFMNSSTGQLQLAGDLFEMQKRIDHEYLQLRPVVSKISQLTGEDIEDVAKLADQVTEHVQTYSKRYGKAVINMASATAVNKLANKCVDKMEDVQKWRSETEKSVKRLKRDERTLKMRAIQSVTKAMSVLTNAYRDIGTKAMNALNNAKNKKKNKESEDL